MNFTFFFLRASNGEESKEVLKFYGALFPLLDY